MPWYRLEENLARVHRFYDQEAWETLVSGAEALDKQAHVEGFDQAQREAAELNDAAGPISEDRRNRMGQIYYSAKLHFHLMEFSDEARIGFERLKQQMRRIWPHHEDPARRTNQQEDAAASGEEGQHNSDDDGNGGGSRAGTVSVPGGFFSDDDSERSGRSNATGTDHDKKVLSVFNEIKQISMDTNFVPATELAEFLRDFARDGGLLDHEAFLFGHLLTRFTHQRLHDLRGLLETHQARWGTPFLGEILQLVCDIDQNFGDYTEASSQATATESRTSRSRRNSGLSDQDFPELRRRPTVNNDPRESVETTRSPPRHLRPAQPVGEYFSRFVTPGNFQPRFTRNYQRGSSPPTEQENFQARFPGRPSPRSSPPRGSAMAHSFQGPQPALRAFDIPPQPRTSNPFYALLGGTKSRPATTLGTSSGHAGREFTGFGRIKQQANREESATPGRVPGTERVPSADRRPGGEIRTGTEERSDAPGGGRRGGVEPPRRDDQGDPPDGVRTTGAEVNIAILQLLDKVTDKVNASSNPVARSTTRIKFPDVKCSLFDGDHLNFLPWMIDFTEMLRVDENLTEHNKLTLLKMHLTKSVKTELNFTTSATMDYESCLELLISKYGRVTEIKRAYRKKISELPAPTNWKGLDKLVRECQQLLNALLAIGQQTDRIADTTVDTLLDKLPQWMYTIVITFTYIETRQNPAELDLSDLLQVLGKCARNQEDVDNRNRSRVSRPENSRDQERGKNRQQNRNRTETTEHRQTTMVTTDDGTKTTVPYCALCQSREHWADGCKQYVTPTQRRERFVELKLCFKCAKAHPGGVQACTSTWKCGAKLKDSRCTRNHHIALHDYYSNRAPAGPPQGGDRGTSRGRSASPSPRVRFVDEKDKRQTDRTESGNGRRRE